MAQNRDSVTGALSPECGDPLQFTIVHCTSFLVSCQCRLFVIENISIKVICVQKNDMTFILLTFVRITTTVITMQISHLKSNR